MAAKSLSNPSHTSVIARAAALAAGAKGEDAYGYRAEAVGLMRLAQSLAAR